jgi:hypothetical protein
MWRSIYLKDAMMQSRAEFEIGGAWDLEITGLVPGYVVDKAFGVMEYHRCWVSYALGRKADDELYNKICTFIERVHRCARYAWYARSVKRF